MREKDGEVADNTRKSRGCQKYAALIKLQCIGIYSFYLKRVGAGASSLLRQERADNDQDKERADNDNDNDKDKDNDKRELIKGCFVRFSHAFSSSQLQFNIFTRFGVHFVMNISVDDLRVFFMCQIDVIYISSSCIN